MKNRLEDIKTRINYCEVLLEILEQKQKRAVN